MVSVTVWCCRIDVWLFIATMLLMCQAVAPNEETHPNQKKPHSWLRRNLQENLTGQDVVVLDSNTTHKIIGGTPSSSTYPYFGYWDRGCGASLIAPDIMLSAAHCTVGQHSGNGKVFFNSLNLEQGTPMGVVEIIHHPRYDQSTENRDFALLKLSGPAPTGTSSISLNRNDARPAEGYSNLLVMGFGMTNVNVEERSPVLQEIQVTAEDNMCRNAYPSRFDPEFMLCAAQTNKDACKGDSGGPLVDTVNNVQVGVVSYGRGCAEAEYPGVYSRVSAVTDWIDDEVCRNSCSPPASCHPMIRHPCAGTVASYGKSGAPSLLLRVKVVADQYASEVSILFKHVDTGQELWFVDYDTIASDKFAASETFVFERVFANVPPGQFYLAVYDRAGDGVCCQYGAGYVEVTNAKTGQEILKRDGTYGEILEYYMDINAFGKASRVDTTPRGPDNSTDFGYDFYPEIDDPDWPGQLYAAGRGGGMNGVTINIRYDLYPEETMWAWEKLVTVTNSANESDSKPLKISGSNFTQDVGQTTRTWVKIDSKPDIGKAKELFSYDEHVEPLNLYRFLVSDSSQDGSCCSWGPGYFTITDSSTVVWELTGNSFTTNVEAYIWVNENGQSQVARQVPGLGYVVDGKMETRNGTSAGGSGMLEIVVWDP